MLAAGGVVCIRAEVLVEVPGRCPVRFPTGRTAWVRPLDVMPDDLAA